MTFSAFKPVCCFFIVPSIVVAAIALWNGAERRDPRTCRYEQAVTLLQGQSSEYRVLPLAYSESPALGYIIARAGDERTRDEFSSLPIQRRRGFVVLHVAVGEAMNEYPRLVQMADFDMSGDPDMIAELLNVFSEVEE
jgi:hypothetical protein